MKKVTEYDKFDASIALLRPAVLLPPEMIDQIRKQMTGTFDAPQAGQNK
jgi:hypothetical protein